VSKEPFDAKKLLAKHVVFNRFKIERVFLRFHIRPNFIDDFFSRARGLILKPCQKLKLGSGIDRFAGHFLFDEKLLRQLKIGQIQSARTDFLFDHRHGFQNLHCFNASAGLVPSIFEMLHAIFIKRPTPIFAIESSPLRLEQLMQHPSQNFALLASARNISFMKRVIAQVFEIHFSLVGLGLNWRESITSFRKAIFQVYRAARSFKFRRRVGS
jgi:hypothetical protein